MGFLMSPHTLTDFELEEYSIIKMNQDLMEFFQEITFHQN